MIVFIVVCRGQLPADLGQLDLLVNMNIEGSGLAAGGVQNSRKQYLPSWLQFDT